MKLRTVLFASLVALTIITATGCAVSRNQETVGSYVDDSVITTRVKSRFIEDKSVDASAVSVETLNGVVMLSGFAKSATERTNAESLASSAKGVKGVKNQLVIRP